MMYSPCTAVGHSALSCVTLGRWLSKWTESETKRQIAQVLGAHPCQQVSSHCDWFYCCNCSHAMRCCCTGVPYNSQRGRYIGGYFGFAMSFTSFTLLRSTINLFFALGEHLI